MEVELYKIAGEHGFDINSNNGAYMCGTSYNLTKKVEVSAALQTSQAKSTSEHPNITSVSQQCKVSRSFVRTFAGEVEQHGKALLPDQKGRHTDSEPGAKELDEIDTFIILLLYMEEPSLGLMTWHMPHGCIISLEHRSVKVYYLGSSKRLFLLGGIVPSKPHSI